MPRAVDSPWSAPETVAGFVRARANETLLGFAADELERTGGGRALDLGCGAGRNALPMAALGWQVVGVDLSWPMLLAAARKSREEKLDSRIHLLRSPMDQLGLGARSCDLLVAHGIWNLARSAAELRRGVAEAARVARPGAGLFVFTFSRDTLGPEVEPVAGESFVFTEFSGEPQCFLTAGQLVEELAAGGFALEPSLPWREHNRVRSRTLQRGTPVIHEAAFRRL